ncbi:MAG TPA: glycosyltransferase [Ignavibacteria bacterium]|nr:glycosyltransferase [Ignavibacteria bacterium]HMR40086.1 glycosyltransferase [Ignavibacteria bacterium]
MNKGVSIIVCCYNSAKLLPETLKKIKELSVPEDAGIEVIIVDNNSFDNTCSIARNIKEVNGSKFDFRILKQTIQGLSHSRMMGIENAGFDYILLCDDDNHLHKDYVENTLRIMDKYPETAVLGGESIPVSSADFPFWFDKFSNSYACGKQYDEDGDVTDSRGEIWGAGMVIRRSAVKEIISKGFVSILNDRTGDKLFSGGDIELCYALRLAGWNIRYDTSLKLDHFIKPEKLNWNYLIKLSRGFGIQKVYLDAYTRSDKPVPDNAWKDEARQIIGKLRRTGLHKAAGYKFLKEGNPDLIKIEKLLGKLFELYKIKNKYTLNIENIRTAGWNKNSDL